ncbi:hypothetical protein BH20ACI1_BH20ACI1_03780 [soil metagenome]
MNTTINNTNEITAEAIGILFREIGVAKTLRFLSQVSGGRGDYTKERQEMPDEMSVDEIVAEIMKRREQTSDESFGIKK